MYFKPQFLLLEGISAGELIFVFLVVLLFFGSKSIPKMARTLGRAMRQLEMHLNKFKTILKLLLLAMKN